MLRFAAVGITLFVGFLLVRIANAAESAACDSVLVQQSANLKENNSAFLSWLQIIDEATYNRAQTDAAASGLTAYGMFEGDYKTFSEKRRRYLSTNNYVQTRNNAREEFKSYLTTDQISAWVKCKQDHLELVLYYKDVDQQGATLVLDWTPPGAVGELNSIRIEFPDGKPSPALAALHSLNGIREFPISRKPVGASIRGSVGGRAGINHSDYSASVYIPKFDSDKSTIAPERLIVSQAGQVRESTAYWASGKGKASWICIKVPDGFDLVVAEDYPRNLGQHRGACVPGKPYCDSLHEGCTDTVIKRGCFVNRKWHEWYKANAARLGIPYSKATVCEV